MQSQDSISVGLIAGLVCGALAFLYGVTMESTVVPNLTATAKPYGAPAMLSVFYCAVLGAAGAIACVTKSSSIRCVAIAGMLLIALPLVAGLLSNLSTWDVSDYLIYPLPLAIFVADILLITYLHWRRPNSPTSVRSNQ